MTGRHRRRYSRSKTRSRRLSTCQRSWMYAARSRLRWAASAVAEAPGRVRVRGPRLHEQAVRVAVEHAPALALDPLLAPQQHLAAEAGDRVGQAGIVEPAGGRPQNAVEGVHQDLDRVALDGVAAGSRLLALRHQLVQQRAQDGLPPEERRAAGRDDGIGHRNAGLGPHEIQRIDLEGADQARVQALEVEHDDVRVHAGDGLEHVPARLGLHHRDRADARGDHLPPSQLREVQEVERGDRAGHAIGRQAGELAALDGERDEPQPLHDLEGEPGVGAVVLHEPGPILRKSRRISSALSSPVRVLPSPSTERATASRL